jgi:hypothetical protein
MSLRGAPFTLPPCAFGTKLKPMSRQLIDHAPTTEATESQDPAVVVVTPMWVDGISATAVEISGVYPTFSAPAAIGGECTPIE